MAPRLRSPAAPLVRDTARAGRPTAVWQRWRAALPVVVQCTGAAALAWWVAESLLGHSRPVFAATAAIVCLAAGIGGRARQAVDLLAGVVVGVLVGELVLAVDLGAGPLTALVTVLAALLVVALIDTRPLALIQAGSSALFVLTLPVTQTPFVRLADAAVGGTFGLLASQVVLTPEPTRLLLAPVRAVLADVSASLRALAVADTGSAVAHAHAACAGAGQLDSARLGSWNTVRRTVRGRRHRDRLVRLDERTSDVDLLAAAVLVACSTPRQPPGQGQAGELRRLAGEVDAVADGLAGDEQPAAAQRPLAAVVEALRGLDHGRT